MENVTVITVSVYERKFIEEAIKIADNQQILLKLESHHPIEKHLYDLASSENKTLNIKRYSGFGTKDLPEDICVNFMVTDDIATEFLREEESSVFKSIAKKHQVNFMVDCILDSSLKHLFKEIKTSYPNSTIEETLLNFESFLITDEPIIHTKRWNGMYVDGGLKKNWIRRLNDLPWEVFSMCSGHLSGSHYDWFHGTTGADHPNFDISSPDTSNDRFIEFRRELNKLPNTKAYNQWECYDGSSIFNGLDIGKHKNVILMVDSTLKNDLSSHEELSDWWDQILSRLEYLSSM